MTETAAGKHNRFHEDPGGGPAPWGTRQLQAAAAMSGQRHIVLAVYEPREYEPVVRAVPVRREAQEGATPMTIVRRLALLAMLSVYLAVPAGCASIPMIIQIAGYVVSAMDIAIQAAQTFTEANVADPATRAKVLNDIARARAAEAAFQALVNGGAALDSKDVTEALADFAVAWNDVEALLKDFGVMTAAPEGRVGVGELAGRLVLPSAEAMMPKGADVAAIRSRAAAKQAARAQARRSLDTENGFAAR